MRLELHIYNDDIDGSQLDWRRQIDRQQRRRRRRRRQAIEGPFLMHKVAAYTKRRQNDRDGKKIAEKE